MRPSAGLAVAALLAISAGASGQSITSVTGLGYPMDGLDARTQILGGTGVGLGGFNASLTNPAGAAGMTRRGGVLALANTSRDLTLGDETGSSGATRFPLIRVILPVRGVTLSVGYGGVLDQSWGVRTVGEIDVGGEGLPFQEEIGSSGGLGEFQLAAALPLGENLALGASLGALTGNQRVRLTRRFDTTAVSDYRPFDETFAWRYSGLAARAAAEWRLPSVAQAGVSLSWASSVSADSTDGRATDREFDMPFQAAMGASAYLGPSLLAAVSARWSGWSGADATGAASVDGLSGARDTWEVGAGLELDNPESRDTRHFPVRVGFQYRQLPFTFVSDAPSEW
ncbi:MAG TPA: hypothetical protein VK966_10985, partial [Longimicrobiales bacterium]|nr:hypothetical protein [Longimicrobiales bacterium]